MQFGWFKVLVALYCKNKIGSLSKCWQQNYVRTSAKRLEYNFCVPIKVFHQTHLLNII